MKALIWRFVRVFVSAAAVSGWAALRGDPDFARFLVEYGWTIALVSALAKYLRDRFGWTWLPL